MNRAEKRRQQREVGKAAQTINKLTPNQVKIIDQVSTEKAYMKAESLLISYQRVVNASLFENGFSIKQVEKIFNLANELMLEEEEKSKKLSEELKRSENADMAKKKIEEGVLSEINKLMDAGKSKKEVIEAVMFKFPSMSKAMVINAYQEAKESRREEEDPIIKDAMEYIFEEEKEMGKDKVAEKIGKEVEKETVNPVVVTKAIVEQANLNPAIEVKGLKIKSMVVEGENGNYRVCSEGVELKNEGLLMFFENPEQLDNFYKEYKQVFEMIKA